jgi:predicted nucleic acid-binding protein
MNVLVDTSVWSLALRRRSQDLNSNENEIVKELRELVQEGRVVVIAVVRQEILSGIKGKASYQKLRDRLREFPDLVPSTSDYEQAAELGNTCRANGISGSAIDFLICSIVVSNNLSILTTDRDFENYETVLPIRIHDVRLSEKKG